MQHFWGWKLKKICNTNKFNLLIPLSNTFFKQIKFKRRNVILYSCNTIVSKKHVFDARLVVSAIT